MGDMATSLVSSPSYFCFSESNMGMTDDTVILFRFKNLGFACNQVSNFSRAQNDITETSINST